MIYTSFILKIRKIIKKEGFKKIIIINKGYFVFYHFLSVIYFWNYSNLPKLQKSKLGTFYLTTKKFHIKTNLTKNSNGKIFIKLLTKEKDYKFTINNTNDYKKNNTELYLRHIKTIKKGLITVKDYNKINIYTIYLKILEKI